MSKKIRPIAIYLPQFHPIPENDEWWGKGFTEWTNVTKANPLFKNHYQPHLPSDLGFYDLRLPDVREAQANLAREYGIHGFCYYHYWFNGKRLLHRPIDEVLSSGKPDFPFCLCWANETWSRRWNEADQPVLLKQEHSFEDDKKHIHFLFSFFRDSRYIRIDDKPVFLVYRPELFPDLKKTTEIWRTEAVKNGFKDLYLIYVDYFTTGVHPEKIGFDAAFDFQPNWHNAPGRYFGTIKDRLWHKLNLKKSIYSLTSVYDYKAFTEKMMEQSPVSYKKYPGITPCWDNSARKKSKGAILLNSSPELYKKWLKNIVEKFEPYSKDENLIFINAWNEWAEGCHLEPCQRFGRAYLESTLDVLKPFIG